eukprot:1316343-Amphidinium_carterae.1
MARLWMYPQRKGFRPSPWTFVLYNRCHSTKHTPAQSSDVVDVAQSKQPKLHEAQQSSWRPSTLELGWNFDISSAGASKATLPHPSDACLQHMQQLGETMRMQEMQRMPQSHEMDSPEIPSHVPSMSWGSFNSRVESQELLKEYLVNFALCMLHVQARLHTSCLLHAFRISWHFVSLSSEPLVDAGWKGTRATPCEGVTRCGSERRGGCQTADGAGGTVRNPSGEKYKVEDELGSLGLRPDYTYDRL